MARKVKNAVSAAVAGANVASIKDLGVQTAGHRARGVALGHAALKLWPALATDFAKGDKDNWARFDDGSRTAYDDTHTAPVAVRDEKGRYTLINAGDGVEGQHLSAAYLASQTPADWSRIKNDSPTLWTVMDQVRERIGNYVRDNRRNLRDNVNKAMGGVSRKARVTNRTMPSIIADTVATLRAKIKLDLGNKAIDQAEHDKVLAWLIDGEKLFKKD